MLGWRCLVLSALIIDSMSAIPVALIPKMKSVEPVYVGISYDADGSENMSTSKLFLQNATNAVMDMQSTKNRWYYRKWNFDGSENYRTYPGFSIWGDCVRDGDCVQNAIKNPKYGNRNSCKVRVTEKASNVVVKKPFIIVTPWDQLLINGYPLNVLGGYKHPYIYIKKYVPKVLSIGSTIDWTCREHDYSVIKAGWKICLHGACTDVRLTNIRVTNQRTRQAPKIEAFLPVSDNNCQGSTAKEHETKWYAEKTNTNSYTLSKSIEQIFSSRITHYQNSSITVDSSVTVTAAAGFNVGVAAVKRNVSVTLGASFGWEENNVATHTRESITVDSSCSFKNVNERSCLERSSTFPVPAYSHVIYSGFTSTGVVDIDWTATAICQSKDGSELDRQEVSGTYVGTRTSDTKFNTENVICPPPVDDWIDWFD